MKKKRGSKGFITNRRAGFDYDLSESFQAGLVLSGPEVRSVRMNHASLAGSFVIIKDGEAWLLNAQIMPVKTNAAHLSSEIQTRNRKLLLKKRELDELTQAKNGGYTIIPTKLLTNGRFIKLEIAIGRGRKKYDKREVIKKREAERSTRRVSSL